MVGIMSLWLPILVSAVFVFIVSSIIHTVLTYHQKDFGKVPSEDEVMDALRPFDIPPGDYVTPCPASMEERKSEAFQKKCAKGPLVFMTVMKHSDVTDMKASLIQWFIYSVVVGILAAYVAGRALPAGADYLAVFRLAGVTAIAGYGLALFQNSIWYKRNWGATLKSVFDALIYGLITAGVFGWLWPGA